MLKGEPGRPRPWCRSAAAGRREARLGRAIRLSPCRLSAWKETRECPTLGIARIWIDVEDVMALYATIAGNVAIEWGPEAYSYGRREFAIKDPNGYLLVFSERTKDPPDC